MKEIETYRRASEIGSGNHLMWDKPCRRMDIMSTRQQG